MVFNNIRNYYKGMDEERKIWVKSGCLQFPISFAMFWIGFWTLASCKIEKVSLILIMMGFVMAILALSYIALGFSSAKCVVFSYLSYCLKAIAFIVQVMLQTWAWNNNLCPPFTQYSFNYDDKSSENLCPFWPIRPAIFILTIDVVYSLFGFLKMFCTLCVTIYECRDDISECFSKFFKNICENYKSMDEKRKRWVQTYQGERMSDSNEEISLVDDTNLSNTDSENEKNNESHND